MIKDCRNVIQQEFEHLKNRKKQLSHYQYRKEMLRLKMILIKYCSKEVLKKIKHLF